MAIRQSQIASNQQLLDQFRDFFNTNRYESKGRDNHSYFGTVDVYHMNDHDSHKVREAKNRQLEHINVESHRFNSTYHNSHLQHHSHHHLGPYHCNIHRLLPDRVAVKTFQPTQSTAAGIRDYLASYNGAYQTQLYRGPEFVKVFAADETHDGLKIFFEYNTTLNEDIRNRYDLRNPYSEELLWKLLTDLVSASSKLGDRGQSLNDIRPSRISFNDYQASVLPFDIGNSRDTSLSQKWQSGEVVFYSQELLNEWKGTQSLRGSHHRLSVNNESFQIGLTVLAAGLLLTEEQVGVTSQRGFDQQRLNQLLNDFGAIYSKKDRLLHVFLSELLLGPGRLSPSQVYDILRPNTECIQFLEPEFKSSVRAHLNKNYGYSQAEQQLGLTTSNHQLSHLWDRYRAHFYVESVQRDNAAQELEIQRRNEQTQRIIADQERKNQLLLQQPGIRRNGVTTTVLRSSGIHHSGTIRQSVQQSGSQIYSSNIPNQYPTQFVRESQQVRGSNIQQSVFRQSQVHH